jgi:hypothetical protein
VVVVKSFDSQKYTFMNTRLRNFFIITLVNLILLGGALVLAENFASARLALARAQFITTEAAEFYKKYASQINHLRAFDFEKKMYPSAPRSITNLLFTEVGDGSREVLIQGDSWAEQLIVDFPSYFALEIFSEQNNVKFIVGGTNSFSPSIMEAQLEVLRRDFGQSPRVVVGVIDQTDIGDELCRYRDQITTSAEGRHIVKPYDGAVLVPYNTFQYFKLLDVLDSSGSALFRLLKYKFLKMRSPPLGGCSQEILSPLIQGISDKDSDYVISRINSYIEAVFKDINVEKLILVTHFHEKHLSGIYTLNVASLVNNAVIRSPHRSKINHLDFTPDAYSGDVINKIFVPGDIYSHLNDHFHRKIYTRDILKKVDSALSQLN